MKFQYTYDIRFWPAVGLTAEDYGVEQLVTVNTKTVDATTIYEARQLVLSALKRDVYQTGCSDNITLRDNPPNMMVWDKNCERLLMEFTGFKHKQLS